MSKQGSAVSKLQEKYLLQTHELVHRIVTRKIGKLHFDSVEDIKQQIFLKLWKWKSKRRDKELSEEEWQKFANTVAHNEINSFFSGAQNKNLLFSQMGEGFEEGLLSEHPASVGNNSGGNSLVETYSLLKLVWKLMQGLTLRQKYAYLFHQPDFIIDFISNECCSMKELARYFEMAEEEFTTVFELYPLPDEKTAELLEKKLNKGKRISVQNIWKARSEAKKKIAKQLAEYIDHGRTPDRGRI